MRLIGTTLNTPQKCYKSKNEIIDVEVTLKYHSIIQIGFYYIYVIKLMCINFNLLMENGSILNKPKQVSFYLARSFPDAYPWHVPQVFISSEMKKLHVYLFFVNIDAIITFHLHLYFQLHNLSKERSKRQQVGTFNFQFIYILLCNGECSFYKRSFLGLQNKKKDPRFVAAETSQRRRRQQQQQHRKQKQCLLSFMVNDREAELPGIHLRRSHQWKPKLSMHLYSKVLLNFLCKQIYGLANVHTHCTAFVCGEHVSALEELLEYVKRSLAQWESKGGVGRDLNHRQEP